MYTVSLIRAESYELQELRSRRALKDTAPRHEVSPLGHKASHARAS